MDELMQSTSIIILAAGEGKRLAQQGTPKPLTTIHGEPLLIRTIRQFHEVGFNKFIIVLGHESEKIKKTVDAAFPNITFVKNDKYKEDRNILSLILGLEQGKAGNNVIVIEGDVVFSDQTPVMLLPIVRKGLSTWLTNGTFKSWQKGGIISINSNNDIQEIKYSEYEPSLSCWYKNLGCIFISASQVSTFLNYLKDYARLSLDTYYMTPWAENLKTLPAKMFDVGENNATSFNTQEEFAHIQNVVRRPENITIPQITLISPHRLRHIEDFDESRAVWLADKIKNDGYWDSPLLIDKKHGLVMDGQHRLEAANILQLTTIPVIKLDYAHIPVFSLRPEEYTVTAEEIVTRALEGNIYPYKTAKHIFPADLPGCKFLLAELGWKKCV